MGEQEMRVGRWMGARQCSTFEQSKLLDVFKRQ